jgi:hypothetical protein
MWLFTETGFISAVRTTPGSSLLRVRGRDRQSLEDLAVSAGVGIDHSPTRDYPYRVEVTTEQLNTWLLDQTEQLDYTNFKNRVHETRGHEFAGALTRVWSVMHEVEDAESRSR